MGASGDEEDYGEGKDDGGVTMTKTGSNCEGWRWARTGAKRVAKMRTRARRTKTRVLDEHNHTAWCEGLGR